MVDVPADSRREYASHSNDMAVTASQRTSMGFTLDNFRTGRNECYIRTVIMDQAQNSTDECELRLEAAIAALTMSSARLKDVIFAGPEEAVDSAFASLRMARMRFLAVRAEYREVCKQDF